MNRLEKSHFDAEVIGPFPVVNCVDYDLFGCDLLIDAQNTRSTREWEVADAMLRDRIEFPDESGIDADAGRWAVGILQVLRRMGLDAPAPFVDGDGNVVFCWKRDPRLYSLIVSATHVSLMISKGYDIEFASSEYPVDKELPRQLWNHLAALARGKNFQIVGNASTSRSLVTSIGFGGSSYIQECIPLILDKQNSQVFLLPHFNSLARTVDESPCVGRSTPALLSATS